jgi:isopenicillin N synthase-like dioxygenase
VDQLPVIDVSALAGDEVGGDDDGAGVAEVARRIDSACRRHGFFLVTGHGVDTELQPRLDAAGRSFFAQPEEVKDQVAMRHGGRAWRGWFPLGGELTSGRPDQKEGYYFGAEIPADDPRVRSGVPLHGPNLFPTEPADLGPAVLAWIDAMTALAHRLMEGVALGLGLDRRWFAHELTADPTTLFRIFRYPPSTDPDRDEQRWGVAEHTDYGLLTILAQDGSGGLQVRSGDSWIDVPPLAGSFVCNIGDMLDRMTGGRYRSTPHRVLATAADRLSFPFFFDPGWDAEVAPLPLDGEPPTDDAMTRWDATSVHEYQGTYGDYLTAKVAKVFPSLVDTTA